MTDLEEKFLKKNIPGKYSTWSEYREEDHNDETSEASQGCDSDEEDLNHHHRHGTRNDSQQPSSSTSAPIAPRSGHNTGVKGVLNDHRQAKQSEKLQIAQERRDRQEAFRQATTAKLMKPGEQSISIASLQKNKRQENHSDSNSESDSESDLDDDDEFMQSYRQARISQMKALSQPTYPTYGQIGEVTSAIQFSQVIDDTPPNVYSIFHLYDPTYNICIAMDELLGKLARDDMDYARFFRMQADIVKPNFDPIGFPCILVYCNGKEVANLTPITKHLDSPSPGGWDSGRGNRFTAEDVQSVLISYGVRRPG